MRERDRKNRRENNAGKQGAAIPQTCVTNYLITATLQDMAAWIAGRYTQPRARMRMMTATVSPCAMPAAFRTASFSGSR